MKILFAFILFATTMYSQNEINWDGKYQLQLSDFQSASTQIGNVNVNNLFMACGFEFSFAMSSIEFMFTKNFNSKVSNTFKRDSSSMVAIDNENAKKMLSFVQYEFDLSEVYARKLRKKIFEDKKAFSEVNLLKTMYDDMQKKFSEEVANASKKTDLGYKSDLLKILHEQVLKELAELSDFCKECKAPKIKK